MKIGRNDPCPCGSGKKYKHCHGRAPLAISEALAFEPGDDLVLPDRRAMERALADLTEAVAERELDSDEALDAFLQTLDHVGPPRRVPTTPLERAQDLMYDAWDAHGPRRVQLARQALRLSPDCADAYVLLAEETARTPREARDLYAKGVAAGERALGPRFFDEEVGRFWGILETRPYMRARLGLAQCLTALGREQEAIRHERELLRLNPGDNQGVRYLLLALLTRRGDWTAAQALLDDYAGEVSAIWAYGRALVAFGLHGDDPTARRAQAVARRANPHVPAYLVGAKRLPRLLPEYVGIGDDREAQHYAAEHAASWQATPGALDWLRNTGSSLDARRERPRAAYDGPRFFLNPYEDAAFTRCPQCEQPTKVRKNYIVVHVEPMLLISLNISGRYCEACNLLILKQSKMEALMAHAAEQHDPSVIGNDYLVMGVLDRADGRQAKAGALDSAEIVDRLHLFREQVNFRPEPFGWYQRDE